MNKMITMSQNNKLEREIISNIGVFFMYHVHTHAHLDLRVWHFSPWIPDLTLQHIQYKYATLFIPI